MTTENSVLKLLPELQGEEMIYIQKLLDGMTADSALTFSTVYRSRRKDPNIILITALLGFVIAAGVHRFLLGQIGMGVLYLFTGGLCFIGTIMDLINHKQMAFEYNVKVAEEVAMMTE